MTAHAQGTFQFTVNLSGANVVPPNSSTAIGSGNFTLDSNNLFTGSIGLPYLNATVRVHGPAAEGSVAPALFDFTPGGIVAPSPDGDPAASRQYNVSRTLSGSEINQLMSGLWYVNASDANYPDGDLRGQITAVPEPSSVLLALLGTGIFVWRGHRAAKW